MLAAVVPVAQVLDPGGGEAFGLVDDDQLDVVGHRLRTGLGIHMLVDTAVDSGVQSFEVVA
ncbi:hypothetical protein GCM10011610_26970 [Nocardia rhizosphaerihabitans]|uniref:Uncharacterized protein n=1 Tax=Nocardia rhizosphaerihabitans TaxID=1691570 RepID=A0ABQ2KDZ9_9NOCA|nr:hypothetical protein GCM10011610_26970 [Nocardia rhizosphaerihabitans]